MKLYEYMNVGDLLVSNSILYRRLCRPPRMTGMGLPTHYSCTCQVLPKLFYIVHVHASGMHSAIKHVAHV